MDEEENMLWDPLYYTILPPNTTEIHREVSPKNPHPAVCRGCHRDNPSPSTSTFSSRFRNVRWTKMEFSPAILALMRFVYTVEAPPTPQQRSEVVQTIASTYLCSEVYILKAMIGGKIAMHPPKESLLSLCSLPRHPGIISSPRYSVPQ